MGFLGISQSFCLTSNCKLVLTLKTEWALPCILFFPQALNLLDFPQIYLLFIDIFINMLFILKWFDLFLLQYRDTVFYIWHFIFDKVKIYLCMNENKEMKHSELWRLHVMVF